MKRTDSMPPGTPPPAVDEGAANEAAAADDEHGAPEGQRLRVLQDDNRRLGDMLAAAGRLAEFGRLAAKQIHELRQPLFAIKGLAQLLLDREAVDVGEVRDFARHIVEQSERLTQLVGDLRQVSLPAPQTSQRVSEVAPVLLRVASLLDWRFRKGVTLRTELAADLPPVGVAPHELEQVLINLLSNALDAVAGNPHPIIQVRVTRVAPVRAGEPSSSQTAAQPSSAQSSPAKDGQGAAIELCVADNGHGIPRTARARLFDNFFTTKGDEAGTGLGLAVSREIARGAGGELVLLESPGTWTESAATAFRLTLPAAERRTRR